MHTKFEILSILSSGGKCASNRGPKSLAFDSSKSADRWAASNGFNKSVALLTPSPAAISNACHAVSSSGDCDLI